MSFHAPLAKDLWKYELCLQMWEAPGFHHSPLEKKTESCICLNFSNEKEGKSARCIESRKWIQ